MTSINIASLQQFSSLFNRYSSNSISDEYKKNLYLAQISREDRRASTQNFVENAFGTLEEEQSVSQISDEVTISQSAEYNEPKTRANSHALKTNSSENNQSYDNTINQLKVKKNILQQELNRIKQRGSEQAVSLNQEGEKETTQSAEATISLTNRLMTEETPLANVLKRQIDEIEQKIAKNRNKSTVGVNFNPADELSSSQLQHKKTRLEQQLRNLEVEASRSRNWAKDNSRPATEETIEEWGIPSYQDHMEELRIKQEISNLEREIDTLAKKKIIQKTQDALNKIRNISSEITSTDNHLLDIEV